MEFTRQRDHSSASAPQPDCLSCLAPCLSPTAAEANPLGFSSSEQPAGYTSLLPADFGLFHWPEVGIVYHIFLAVPTARQGGVLL